MADTAERDEKGRYYNPPLLNGVLSYSVIGIIPTGKFHPTEKGRMLHRTMFRSPMSTDLRRDVDRALRLGCTSVSVGVNYEPSDEQKREQEEIDRQDEEEAEREREGSGRGIAN